MDYTAVSIHQFYAFLLIGARVGGLIVVAPLLGNRAIPHTVKAGLVLIFTLGITPMIAPHAGPLPQSLVQMAGQVLADAIFGMSLGYLSRLLFAAVEMAGYFVDTQMGFGFVNLINPFAEQQSSVLSTFQYQLAITLYLLMNGHLVLLGALVQSFSVLPPGGVAPKPEFGFVVVPMLKTMFGLGFRLALPAIGVLLVLDVAFGLVARMVPQINVFLVGIPAKIIIGLMTVTLLLPVLGLIVGQIIAGTSTGMDALIAGAR